MTDTKWQLHTITDDIECTMDEEHHVEVQARLDCNCRTAIFDVESVEFAGRNCTIHVSEL